MFRLLTIMLIFGAFSSGSLASSSAFATSFTLTKGSELFEKSKTLLPALPAQGKTPSGGSCTVETTETVSATNPDDQVFILQLFDPGAMRANAVSYLHKFRYFAQIKSAHFLKAVKVFEAPDEEIRTQVIETLMIRRKNKGVVLIIDQAYGDDPVIRTECRLQTK